MISYARISLPLLGACLLSALLAGCTAPTRSGAIAPSPVAQAKSAPPAGPTSSADTPLDYRVDAAYHLYDQNRTRIFHGVMPHYLYAIGVLEIQVDTRGNVAALNWLRAPAHAPEVVAEIEHTVRKAAPFPAPVRLGQASYIETWLWDESGLFQLHTLSEGQGAYGTPPREVPPDPRALRVVSAPSIQ